MWFQGHRWSRPTLSLPGRRVGGHTLDDESATGDEVVGGTVDPGTLFTWGWWGLDGVVTET